MKEREGLIKILNDFKLKSKEEDSKYRKNEQDLELKKMKQNSIEAEMSELKSKISNYNTELKIFKRELTG